MASYQSVHQCEPEDGETHDAIHLEEGGIQPGQIARLYQSVLVGENQSGDPYTDVEPEAESGAQTEQGQSGNGDPVQELREENASPLTQSHNRAPQSFSFVERLIRQRV